MHNASQLRIKALHDTAGACVAQEGRLRSKGPSAQMADLQRHQGLLQAQVLGLELNCASNLYLAFFIVPVDRLLNPNKQKQLRTCRHQACWGHQ